MWICPKCNREFKKENQSHYCGTAPNVVEEYIAEQQEEARPYLEKVRATLKEALPEAEERISWSMPTYWKQHNIIHFAAHKKHIGLYPGPAAVEHFAEQLKPYKASKGSIQIPYKEPLPLDLIVEIARWCVETDNHA